MSPSYDIEILYREPTFELRGSEREEPFSWNYEVTASTPEFAFEEALARFREMAADSGVSWIRKVVVIRVRPITPHAMELGPPERSRVLSEPGGEQHSMEDRIRSVLLRNQDHLAEELLIILWTRLRDNYLHSWPWKQNKGRLHQALGDLDRLKLWEWTFIYDRMALHYRDLPGVENQFEHLTDLEDSPSVGEAWRAWFLQEVEALQESADFVPAALNLATTCDSASLEEARQAVRENLEIRYSREPEAATITSEEARRAGEEHLEARYASGPEPERTEFQEAPLFGALSRFLRSRKKKAEARRELEQRREEEADQRRMELARQEHLRQQDPIVDMILKSLLLAKLDFERLLEGIDEWAPQTEELESLQRWRTDHAEVMDFSVFEAICRYFPSPDEDDPFLAIDEIRELLEDQCDDMTCFYYADKKLGIAREFQFCDDMTRSWVRYERPGGSFENVDRRFSRVLRELDEVGRSHE
jgi:hypothetical protein